MKALFLGAPGAFTARPLWEWLGRGHTVAAFWQASCVSDRQWRNDRIFRFARPGWSVSAALARHRIPLCTVRRPKENPNFVDDALALGADAIISAGFAWVVPRRLLAAFGNRAVNLHPAMLPQYRGAQPLHWMLRNGEADRYGGVTLHVMTPKLDEGDIIAQRHVPWTDGGRFHAWQIELSRAAGRLVADDLEPFLAGRTSARPQTEPSSYYSILPREKYTVDGSLTAEHLRLLSDSLGSTRPLVFESPRGPLKISGFARRLGPRIGRPPRVTLTHVEFDAADARVRLRRWLPGTSKAFRLRNLLLYVRSSPNAPDVHSQEIIPERRRAA